jgi:L-amino acid N-acyltransferase YncA
MGITNDASGDGSPSSIRLATERDAGQVAAIYAPNVTDTIISFETEPPSADEMRRRIEVTLERYPWLVCEHRGRVLGYAYAGPHGSRAAYRWSVERVGLRPRGGAPEGGGAGPLCLAHRGA